MHIRKAALVCDGCGAKVEVDPDREHVTLGGPTTRGTELDGWVDAGSDHHLCPSCAEPYLAKKAEMERELRRLAGIRSVSFEI